MAAGWTASRACAVREVDRRRWWRWNHRRAAGLPLDDLASSGGAVHGLLECEEAEIVALYDDWADIDRSHRKLAHRESYENRVWVSPSTVDRVLARNGLALAGEPRAPRSVKQPWPDWAEWRPNQLWCWDASQFEACKAAKYAYAIIDLVSRKWIVTILTGQPDSVAVRVLFTKALDAEGLLDDRLRDRLTDLDAVPDDDDEGLPLLLAISDNGTEMRSKDTRRFMALCSIAQQFGRPSGGPATTAAASCFPVLKTRSAQHTNPTTTTPEPCMFHRFDTRGLGLLVARSELDLSHRVGCHAVHPRSDRLASDEAFHLVPVMGEDGQAVDRRLAAAPGQHEAPHAVLHPQQTLDRPIADALVPRDHDEAQCAHHREPLVVERASRYGDVGIAGVHHVVMVLPQRLSERQVVLIDEEPGRHSALRHQRALVLLVGNRRTYELDVHVVRVGDVPDCFAGVEELPQSFGRDPRHVRLAEAHQRVDHHR